MSTVPEIIVHYQKSIEKSENNRPRLLHCIAKLYKLQITVQHLQETGIGRTVNSLRKDDGEVGVAAKALVAKWKAMVAAEESSDEEQTHLDDDDDKSRSPRHDFDPKPKSNFGGQYTDQESSEPSQNGNTKRTNSDKGNYKSSTSGSHHSRNQSPSTSTLMSFDFLKPTEDNEEDNRPVSSGSAEKPRISSSHKTHHKSSSSHRTETKDHHKSRSKDHTTKSSSDEKKSHSSSKDSRKNHKSTHSTTSGDHPDGSSGSRKEDNHQKNRSSSSKHKSDENSNEKSSKSNKNDQSSEKTTRKRESSKSSNSSASKKIKLEEPSEVEIDCSMGTSFADALGMMMPSSSKAAKQKATQKSLSSNGTGAKTPTSSNESRPTAPSDERRADKPKASSTPALLSPAAQLAPLEKNLSLELPTISNDYRPMPLNPVVMDCVFKTSNSSQPPIKRFMTDEELGASMSSKTMRTKVYSGVKTGAPLNVPTLHELCLRVLQKNIDALEATGGVPYDILKPVLERATPQQLCTLEHYNPYLMEDTDNLWLQHRNRKFRGQNRRELETWRDMFYRCTEEQSARLSHLTENIKASQAIAVPVKKTKIAFLDSMVKPPRNVAKKQISSRSRMVKKAIERSKKQTRKRSKKSPSNCPWEKLKSDYLDIRTSIPRLVKCVNSSVYVETSDGEELIEELRIVNQHVLKSILRSAGTSVTS